VVYFPGGRIKQIELHEKELPEEVFETWQPKRVIEELLAFDPDTEKDFVLSMGLEGPAGERPKKMFVIGERKALTRKFIGKHYNKLGSFLHAPVFAKLRSGVAVDTHALAPYLLELVPEIEKMCFSPQSNLATFWTFECQACGKKMVRNHESLAPDTIVICTKAECGAGYTVLGFGTDQIALQMIRIEFECPGCNTRQFVDKHRLRHGATIACAACPTSIAVKLVWSLTMPDESTPPP
jgi:transcription elongation factor Elf1